MINEFHAWIWICEYRNLFTKTNTAFVSFKNPKRILPPRFRAITSSYYRGALGAMLVYDISRRSSYENVSKWLLELREFGGEDMVVVLVGNKCDLDGQSREVDKEEGKGFAETEGLCFMETSALKNLNVEEVFLQMITRIYDMTSQKNLAAKMDEKPINLLNGKEIHIADEVTATKQSSTCCSR
ncbi:ras-related protein RABA6b-like isoform X2 [Glycine soja]|uniref:ras-related protein RABA6b-like isoform X2 n=1 Tax=Glycine soja TaxID=3848 RepID=UPI00103FBA4F|nr:ras-related protein RABA6b-like isoform X2 [Glycine soja]XP_040873888.1 ras-related protein RABA6b isoform X2 [Glycine max]